MRVLSRPSLVFLFVSSVLAGQVACRPFLASKRENAPNSNQMLHSSHNLFGVGSMECCTVTLMPTTLEDGSNGVQVVQSCSIIVADSCPSGSQSTTTSCPTVTVSSTTAAPSATETSSVTSPTPTSMTESTGSIIHASTSIISISSTSGAPSPTTTPFFTPPPSSTTTTTSTSSTSTPSQTLANSSAIAITKQSSALPKVIGAFAGISIFCLIVGGTFGYLRHKKLKAKVDGKSISWPTFR